MLRFLNFLLLIFLCGTTQGQDILEKKVSFQVENSTLAEALDELNEVFELNLSYSPDLIPNKKISFAKFENYPVKAILKNFFTDTDLDFRTIGSQIVIFKTEIDIPELKFTISGFVEDAQTGERLIGANVFDQSRQIGTFTNAYGFFSLTLSGGNLQLSISYLGYRSLQQKILLNQNVSGIFKLDPSLTLQEIVISAKPRLESDQLHIHNFDEQLIRSIPALGGESDILRAIGTQSGVQSGAEGVSGLHIRGGSPDQNLVLLDDVPVYNPTHTWGVFSIFNTSAIQHTRFLKGGFPARYGGRLSSVMDIRTKDGNNKKWGGEAEAGLVSLKGSLQGPLIREKASLIFSARHSITNIFTRPYFKNEREKRGEGGEIGYAFYDMNLKLNHNFSNKNRFYVSLYQGGDAFKDDFETNQKNADTTALYSNENEQEWGNTIAAMRWNRTISNKVFLNTTLTYSRYFFQSKTITNLEVLHGENSVQEYLTFTKFNSNIQDRAIKADFDYYPSPSHSIKFGASIIQHEFQPGVVSISDNLTATGSIFNDSLSVNSLDTFWQRAFQRGYEYDAYIEDGFVLKNKHEGNWGIHFSGYQTGSKFYVHLQPRLFYQFKAYKNLKCYFSAQSTAQYLHLLSTSTIGLPEDIWVSATERIKPQTAWQVETGFLLPVKNLGNFSASVYYKKMENLIEFQEASSFLINASNWENAVANGSGQAYGAEFGLKKDFGALRGELNYTYAFAERQFENVNSEKEFPYRYDRRHGLSLNINYKINENWDLQFAGTYATGIAITLPAGIYVTIPGIFLPPIDVPYFESRNGFRMPDYHFADLGAMYHKKLKNGMEQVLKFGIHNVYYRKNPIYYELREKNSYFQRFLPPLLPSFSYIVKI